MGNKIPYFLPYDKLQALIDGLIAEGFSCIGPQVRDNAIVYDVLNDVEQLPWGVRDIQSPGSYSLIELPDKKAFSWANGPGAIKPILFKPRETVWRVVRDEDGKLVFQPQPMEDLPVAIFGARACDVAAMVIQDKVFLSGEHKDTGYLKRRESLFVIGVNCTYSSENCFCVSAGSGPEVRHPVDLLMTEVDEGFVIESGSQRGKKILSSLALEKASSTDTQVAKKGIESAAKSQTKKLPFDNQRALRDLLFANLDHPQWDDVAERCLSCGNCTSVCPTCFCHSEGDKPSLDGTASEHTKEWDSCFTDGHSLLAGKPLRGDTKLRYRQWLTHKVGSWFDQFGTSGCVGCGRCATWCPVGIDITKELAIMAGDADA